MSIPTLVLLLSSLVLCIFAIFFVGFLFFHNRKMNQNKDEIQRLELEKAKKTIIDSIQIQESERARIGADIHDDLGPTMSAMKLKINNLSKEKPASERDINQLKAMIDDTIKSVRGLSHSLYPNTLEKYGFIDAIKELGQRIQNKNLKVNLDINPLMESLDFHAHINIYRIVQEFSNNSLKYSDCNTISIFMAIKNSKIKIVASDNGKGFDIEKIKSRGIGLKNMKMRADAINYDFNLISVLGEGTKITLSSS